MPITPRMVAALGPSPALVVLAWCRKVLLSPSAHDRRYVRRLRDGGRCVAAAQDAIAGETGLSARQVKRGLSVLRREGFVTSWPRRGGSCFGLSAEALAGTVEDPGMGL
jgi:hypothetical protein